MASKKTTTQKTSSSSLKVLEKRRGSATRFEDGSIEFTPDAESDKKLYENLKATRKGSLQKTENIYKVSLKADVDATDPYMQLVKEFMRVVSPLKPKDAGPLKAADTEVIGRTGRSTVSQSKEEIVIVTRLNRHEPNPEVAPLLPNLNEEQKRMLKLELTPIEVFTSEISELCSLINRIGKTK